MIRNPWPGPAKQKAWWNWYIRLVFFSEVRKEQILPEVNRHENCCLLLITITYQSPLRFQGKPLDLIWNKMITHFLWMSEWGSSTQVTVLNFNKQTCKLKTIILVYLFEQRLRSGLFFIFLHGNTNRRVLISIWALW